MTLATPRWHPSSAKPDQTLFRWNVEVSTSACEKESVVLRALACAHGENFFRALEASRREGEIPLLAAPHQREKTKARASACFATESSRAADSGLHPGTALGFLTSGSTGDPVVVWKSDECLRAEAQVLASRFFGEPGEVVAALVPPCHLFGFLFAGIAPAFGNMPVCFVEPGTPAESVPFSRVLVAVPSLFPYVVELLRAGRVRGTVIFSGSPLGPARREALRSLFQEISGNRAFEVLGSTESGGIGVSDVNTSDPLFEPFPSVRLQAGVSRSSSAQGLSTPSEKWLLQSDFLFPAGSVMELADCLAPGPHGTFLHLGRADRIFKYSGKRFSLSEVETRLVELSGATRCVCSFREDLAHPKGGVLVAFLERPRDVAELRRKWHAQGASLQGVAPFPQELHVLESFPVDALGKVTLHALSREVSHGSR